MLQGTTHARLANSPPPYFFFFAPFARLAILVTSSLYTRFKSGKTRQKKEKENQQKNPRSLEAFIV